MRWLLVMLLMVSGGCAGLAGPGSAARNWAESQGGLADGAEVGRLRAMAEPMAKAAGLGPVRMYELNTDRPAAYAWPGEGVFISSGLVRRLSHDELQAAIAHELGHLAIHHACMVARTSALTGTDDSTDVEVRADRVGAEILQCCDQSPGAMPAMLRTMRECFEGDAALCGQFTRRVAALTVK